MFGSKLRTWMEAHIVRPKKKKKKDLKEGEKGFESNCNSPSKYYTRLSVPCQVHPLVSPALTKNLDGIHLQTMTGSSGTSVGVGSVNLSSPESAYSTGYSTDGTSPGASFPPEYYINIRTGKHYFQNRKNTTRGKKNCDANCQPVALLNGRENSATNQSTSVNNKQPKNSQGNTFTKLTEAAKNHYPHYYQSHSPQQDEHRRHTQVSHQRAESFSVNSSINSLSIPSSIPPPLVSGPLQSPRQRSRIRTNPWLSANSSSSASTSGYKSRLTPDESSISSSLKLMESSGSVSDINVSIYRENKKRREYRQESLSAGRSPINQNWRITPGMNIRDVNNSLAMPKRSKIGGRVINSSCSTSSNSTCSASSTTRSVHTSDEDLTLNEMLELEKLDSSGHLYNNKQCSFFSVTNQLGRHDPRLTFIKRRNKEEKANHRSINVGNGVKRQNIHLKKIEKLTSERTVNEKRKKRISQRRKWDDETANLNRVLVERMLLKNSGFNQGSRSVGGTPICLRRKKHDVNKNFSPIKQPSVTEGLISPRQFLVEKKAAEIVKRRSNSVSYVNGKGYMTTFASEIALIEADKEADRKYRELIMEAENILVNMQRNHNTSPVVPSPSRKFHNGLTNKRVELIKNTELNIELALSKSRNSQPELQSGSIKDLEHISPKRQFPRNGNLAISKENHQVKCPDSPLMSRKASHESLIKGLLQNKIRVVNDNLTRTQGLPSNYYAIEQGSPNFNKRAESPSIVKSNAEVMKMQNNYVMEKKNATIPTPLKVESNTSSSSDSEERCEDVDREPLLNFRSIDMDPIKESASYCPQSEPVKRKVYAGSVTFGRIQKTLGEHNVLGDTTNEDTDGSRRSLREKVARLRQERLVAEANLNVQENRVFQQQISQIRRQMLMQTIEGLKRSLEDQSATLKQTCLDSSILNDNFS
ncbi:uncharacterized protein LOC122508297 isoform X2 [Leptopilina heterotoma]|uniref:uncharacterized protein LOC122508297 isoform X2 n=1 Tax=Leptopilina heterotoma TaxID=63436 RepID=UPI001CA92068|nr:uncharacterized protein LOC122508297 isoform X2 [Leptopilina heterotoma]